MVRVRVAGGAAAQISDPPICPTRNCPPPAESHGRPGLSAQADRRLKNDGLDALHFFFCNVVVVLP